MSKAGSGWEEVVASAARCIAALAPVAHLARTPCTACAPDAVDVVRG